MTKERQDLLYTLDPYRYVLSLGIEPYTWQRALLSSPHKRLHVNGARQAGKSTIISSKPCWRARFYPGSLSVVLAATEKQAVEDMERIKSFMAADTDYPEIKRTSDALIELDNKSRILVVPATEKAARGYSSPDIIMLDEDSRIPDEVYQSGVRPMLTHNQKCQMIAISTPNGHTGHFARASRSEHWERYIIRAPYDIDEVEIRLVPAGPEEDFAKACAANGFKGFYSPRHGIIGEQQENLEEMGVLMYRQEYLCEYVEPQDQVFSYDDIARAMAAGVDALPASVLTPAPFDAITFR